MAPRVVDRIKEKLSRRRHSFTGSLKSAKSTASSVKSGRHGHGHGQHDDDEAKQSRSVTPSQLQASQLHDDHDHDHDQDQDLGLTSSSSSASSTTTTTRTSHDHGDEKLQHQHQLLLQRRTSDGRDEGHESAPQQTQAQTTSEEKTKPDGGEGPGDGGAARDEEGKDSQEGPPAAAAPLNSVQGSLSLTGSIVTAASTGESATESAPEPAAESAAAPTQASAAPAVVAVAAKATASDPPNRHQPVAASLLNSPPPVSTLSSSSSSSSFHSAPLATLNPNFALTLASAQKPTPPPLPRQNSWQYRRAATHLQSIDEDSDPPSPTTVTSPKVAIADTSATASSDDSSSSSDGGGGDGADNDSSDEDGDTIGKRLQKIEEKRDKDRAAARAAAAAAAAAVAAASPIPCPRSRNANNKQLSVTAPESSSSSHAPHPPPTQSDPLQVPSGLAAPDTAVAARKQSIFQNLNSHWAKGYLDEEDDAGSTIPASELEFAMTTRKIWVKRPNASPTLVTIKEDDLVDDVRDTILTKYGNSLGKTFDSPDLTLRIVPRDQASQKERLLGPEEPMCRTLDTYFPNGQDVNEALLIDTPAPRRHPKPSPRAHALYPDNMQPPENGEGYFPPVTVGGMPSPHRQIVLQAPPATAPTHSIAVLNTGHIPNVPSPGGTRPRYNREQTNRPKLNRTHTSSPTIVGGGHPSGPKSSSSDPSGHRPSHSRAQSNSSDHKPAVGPPLPGSPVAANTQQARVATPPPRVTSPRTSTTKVRKAKKLIIAEPLQPNMLNGTVPPISVLIVEDNPINLKLLEAFVKKLKVRWSTAMNGRDAVTKWRTGGFHLVLMDIQLPVMNGLDATREIRRLERVNSIGVFTSSPSVNGLPDSGSDDTELKDQDRLADMSLFKSPVIIVALTASSLQSDRHEALAAGCNDFLTKPVNFVWLERKIMEWGCMQALIDFDGWRKWKDFSEAQAKEASTKAAGRSRTKKSRNSTLTSISTSS